MTAKSSLGPSGNLDRERTLARAWSEITHSLALLLAADGTILDLNPPTADCLGLPAAEWKGRLFWAEASEAEREAWQAPFRKVLAEGKAVRADLERKGRWYDASFSPGLDPAGKVDGVAIVGWDITERKRAETELRESEERYRAQIEDQVNGFAYCRMIYEDGRPHDFVYLKVNRAFEELSGLKDVVGRRVSELIPHIREVDPQVLEVYGRVARTGVSERFEIHLKTLDMWFAVAVSSAERDYFVAVFEVITERKRAEAVLAEAARTNARLYQSIVALNACPNLDSALACLLQRAVDLGGMDCGGVHIIEGQEAVLRHHVGVSAELAAQAVRRPLSTPYIQAVLAHPKCLLDVVKEFPAQRPPGTADGIRHVHSIGLVGGGRVFGLLSVTSRRADPPSASGLELVRVLVAETESLFARLRTEQALQQLSNEQWTILESVGVGIAHVQKRKVQWANPGHAKMHGYAAGEIVGMDAAAFYARRDDYDRVGREGYGALAKGEVYSREVEMKRKDGSTFWSRVLGRAVSSANPAEGSIWVIEDITEQRRMEAAVRESRAQLQLALACSKTGVWEWDLAGNTVSWSPECFEVFGRKEACPDLESFMRIVHPEDAARALKEARAAISDHAAYSSDFRIIRADGKVRWVRSLGHAEYDASDRPVRLLGTVHDITERKQAEEAQARLAAIVEGSEDAIISKSREGVVLTWNRAAERMFGYRPDEIIGRSMMMLLPPERQHEETLILSALLQGETIRDYETVRLTKDGRRLEVALTASPLKDSAGRVTGASKILRDITERKRAEAALQKVARTNQLLRTSIVALNTCPDLDAALACLVEQAVVLGGMDAGGAYLIEGSEAVLRHQVGLSPEFVEKVARRPLSTPYIRAALEHPQEVLNFVERFPERHSLGAAYGLRHIYCMALLADGEPFGMLAVASRRAEPPQAGDIELIRILAAETQSLFVRFGVQQRLRAVQAAMAEGLVVQAADGTITDCNPSAERILGLTRDQLMGRTSVDPRWQAVREDGSAFSGTEHPAMVSLRTGQSCRGVIMGLRLPDGGQRWININAVPMFKRGETRPYAVVCSFSDITEHRQMEARLRQAQKTEAIAHLTGGIAHQFNNILAGILLGVELVKTPGTQGENPEVLEDMESGCQRAAGLVRQLLALSQQSVMQQRSLDLGATVSEQLRTLRELLGEGIKLEFTRPDALSRVKADEALIKQVLRNLCLNARGAMKRGGVVRLELSEEEVGPEREKVRLDAHAGRFVRLSVSDTGCGMDEGTMKRLFEPFFTTKGVGQGTGLGLATVRGIVQQHQGWVETESQLGKGTTFKVYLPVEALVAETAVATTAKEQAVGGGGTILLAEDEPGLRKVTRRFLDRQGYQVLEAADGEEALAVWAAHRAEIDLIFTDMVMPGRLSGLDVAQRALAEKPGVKVIITSGYNTDRLELEKACEGRILYLPKPCPVEELVALLRRCLGKGFSGGASPGAATGRQPGRGLG